MSKLLWVKWYTYIGHSIYTSIVIFSTYSKPSTAIRYGNWRMLQIDVRVHIQSPLMNSFPPSSKVMDHSITHTLLLQYSI